MVRVMAALAAVCAAVAFAGCYEEDAMRACENHDGVRSTDTYGGLVTCADGTVRGF